jgi:hypothetical protein
MKDINVSELDSLIAIYFGQDYDLFGSGESVEAQIDAWIADTSPSLRQSLIGEIEEFTQECDDLENDFESRYSAEFSIELWGMTSADFLRLLRTKVFDSLS